MALVSMYFILIRLLVLINIASNMRTIPKDILELGLNQCPRRSYCTAEGKQYNESVSKPACCTRCMCTPECSHYKNCCPDYYGHKSKTFQTKCSLVYFKTSSFESPMFIQHNDKFLTLGYLMVTTCRDGTDCIVSTSDDENTTPYDFQPVFSPTYKTHFLNKKCAQCNGIEDVIGWLLKSDGCRIRPEQLHVSEIELQRLIVKECALLALTPSMEQNMEHICSPTTISLCNVTGEWDVYNEHIQEACGDPDGWYPVFRFRRVYKNVYCALCNEINTNAYECEDGDRSLLFEFGEILSLTNERRQSLLVDKCAEDEVFDWFNMKCRTLMCPPLTKAVLSVCTTQLSDIWIDVNYEIHLLLMPISYGVVNVITYMLAQAALDKLDTIANGEFASMKILGNDMEYYTNKTTMFLAFASMRLYVSMANKTYFDMQVLIETLYLNDIIFHVNNDNFIMKPYPTSGIGNSMYAYDQFGDDSTYNIANYSGSYRLTTILVKLENDKFYPYVKMSPSDYCNLSPKSNESHTLFLTDSCPLLYKTFIHGVSDINKNILVEINVFEKLVSNYIRFPNKPTTAGIVSVIFTCCSMTCIAVAFSIFCYLNKMRNAPVTMFGIALCNLFTAQGVFQFGSGWIEVKPVCQIIGIGVHYFWLATVFSFNAYCLLIFQNLQRVQSRLWSRELFMSVAYVFGLPFLFVLTNFVYSSNISSPDTSIGYGSTRCHIDTLLMRYMLFAGPIFVTVVLNCVIYALIVYKVQNISVQSSVIRTSTHYASVYFRLLIVTGITWVFGFINEYVDSVVIEYMFIALVGGQGIILLIFAICNRTVFEELRCKCSHDDQELSVTQSSRY